MDFVIVVAGFTAIAFVVWLVDRRPRREGGRDGGGEAFVAGDSSADCGDGGGGGCD